MKVQADFFACFPPFLSLNPCARLLGIRILAQAQVDGRVRHLAGTDFPISRCQRRRAGRDPREKKAAAGSAAAAFTPDPTIPSYPITLEVAFLEGWGSCTTADPTEPSGTPKR